jgi:predicted nucleotidyltransferase
MPTGGRRTTSANLGDVLEGLLEAGVDFILVGGLAAVIQGAPVTTMDVDIVHSQSPENIGKLLAYLKSVDAVHRRLDDKLIEPKERELSGKGHLLLKTRLGPLDVLAVIEGGRSYEDLLNHTVEIDFRGHTLRVLDLKTLIELKKASTDFKDKQRLPVLKETLRQLGEEYRSEEDEEHGGNK